MLKNTDVLRVFTAVLLLMFGGNADCYMDKKMLINRHKQEIANWYNL